MNATRRFSLLVLAAFTSISGCSGGREVATPDEQDAFDVGSPGSMSMQNAVTVADDVFDFDPTIDPAATADVNAENIRVHVTANLNGCGTVTRSGTSVTVDFGSGCAVVNSTQVSGSLTAMVSRTTNTTQIALTFTNLSVAGRALAGTATFSTTNGTTFTVDANLMSGTKTIVATGLSVAGTTGAITMNGMLSVTENGSTARVTLSSVHYTIGQCYPDSGSMTVLRGVINETIVFDANTATTGVVTVTQGRRSFMMTLPSYGSCPM